MSVRLPELSLVLPAHNEVENIRWLLPHLAITLPLLAERYEVVLVDDGSTDGTGPTATALAAELSMDLRIVRHERKSGYGATVGDGLRAAQPPTWPSPMRTDSSRSPISPCSSPCSPTRTSSVAGGRSATTPPCARW